MNVDEARALERAFAHVANAAHELNDRTIECVRILEQLDTSSVEGARALLVGAVANARGTAADARESLDDYTSILRFIVDEFERAASMPDDDGARAAAIEDMRAKLNTMRSLHDEMHGDSSGDDDDDDDDGGVTESLSKLDAFRQ